MHEGPYRFQPEDAFRFARERGIKARQIGDNLHFEKCPYCGGGGSNDKKTFAIDLRTGVFNCLRGSCLARGNMVTLSREDRKSTRLNSSHIATSRMPSSA